MKALSTTLILPMGSSIQIAFRQIRLEEKLSQEMNLLRIKKYNGKFLIFPFTEPLRHLQTKSFIQQLSLYPVAVQPTETCAHPSCREQTAALNCWLKHSQAKAQLLFVMTNLRLDRTLKRTYPNSLAKLACKATQKNQEVLLKH